MLESNLVEYLIKYKVRPYVPIIAMPHSYPMGGARMGI